MSNCDSHEHVFYDIPGIGERRTMCGYPKPDPDPKLESLKARADAATAALEAALAKKEAPPAEVTRTHREYAIASILEQRIWPADESWADTGVETSPWHSLFACVAQAIADAESRGRAQAAAPDEQVEADIALVRLVLESAIGASGVHPSGSYAALNRLEKRLRGER